MVFDRAKSWSSGQFAVFVIGGVLLEGFLWVVNRATKPPLLNIRIEGANHFYEDNVEPLVHFGSWTLLIAVPVVVLLVAWKYFDSGSANGTSA